MFKYLTLGLVGLCACHTPDKASPMAVTTPTPLRIVAVDYAFDSVADTVAGGNRTVRLVNHGHQAHMIALMRMDSTHSVAEYVRELHAGHSPVWVEDHGGPHLTLPGDSTTMEVTLPAGSYAITCWVLDSMGAPHIKIGMIRQLDVVQSSGAAQPEPVADDTVTLTSYRLALAHPLTAGAHVLRIENVDSGTIDHDLVIIHVLPGHTLDEVEDWLGTTHGTPVSFDSPGGVTGIMPGHHAELYATLVPGNYAILCMMPDHADSKPHYRHGMVSAFTVQ